MFQESQTSEPSLRIVGISIFQESSATDCASSIQQMSIPSVDFIGCLSLLALTAAGIAVGLDCFHTGKPFLKPALGGILLFGLAILTWRQCGMYANEETLWRATLTTNPHCVIAHNNLGELLLRRGQADEAIAHFQEALDSDPDDVDVHNNLGNALLQKGRRDEAIAHYHRALAIQPDYAKAHYNLGHALLSTARINEAMSHFQKALAIQPGFAEAHNGLGSALIQTGRGDEAITHFQKALELQPDFAEARYNLGNAFFQKGQLDRAMIHYQMALELQPDHAGIHNNLGWILLQNGRVDEAITHFQAALKIQPDIAPIHVNLAIALLRKGQAREAVAQYEAALKLQRDNVRALSDLARLLATWPDAAVRDGAQAVELAQRANRLSNGQDPAILQTLAAAFAEAGQFSQSVATAQRALRLADSPPNRELADAIRSQIELYQARKPFRDPGPTNAPTKSNQTNFSIRAQ